MSKYEILKKKVFRVYVCNAVILAVVIRFSQLLDNYLMESEFRKRCFHSCSSFLYCEPKVVVFSHLLRCRIGRWSALLVSLLRCSSWFLGGGVVSESIFPTYGYFRV